MTSEAHTGAAGEGDVRLAAYAVIVRGEDILLSQLAPRIRSDGAWTLPGGGVDFGEHPAEAVVREVREETGLDATVGDTVRVFDLVRPRDDGLSRHSVRIVYEGWVAADAPPPQTLELDGSTVRAAWHPLAAVLSGDLPTVGLVREALREHRPHRRQRVSAYAWCERDGEREREVLLVHDGRTDRWFLPGGGVEHGESLHDAVRREVAEETGLEVEPAALLTASDFHFTGEAPTGRREDFHSVYVVYRASVDPSAEPRPAVEDDIDHAAWVPLSTVRAEELTLARHVLQALEAAT